MAWRYATGIDTRSGCRSRALKSTCRADAPVRAYDAMIDALDLAAVGIERAEGRVGCPQYDPRAMLKLLVYGYSYGVRSSRKLGGSAATTWRSCG